MMTAKLTASKVLAMARKKWPKCRLRENPKALDAEARAGALEVLKANTQRQKEIGAELGRQEERRELRTAAQKINLHSWRWEVSVITLMGGFGWSSVKAHADTLEELAEAIEGGN